MAFCKLNQRYPNTRLYLVGSYESDLDPVRLDILDTINTDPAIEAVGSKSANDLLAYYVASDCFVFPSYREGFPNTVLEAGAMGLPCIVTDINGSREIIENNKNVDALYNAMKQMLLNREQTQQFIANARPMIEARFEQGFVRKCLYEFYEEIIN